MNAEKLREALSGMDDEKLEDVREIIGEELASRSRSRTFRNKYLIAHTNVRMVRAGTRLPRGARGEIIKVKRKKAIVHFENFGTFDVPLSMFEQID
ncbi:MAG: hypothetical protein GF334_13380 [Candidatus Altiarchaeales archaeon]|nr:hypothetical protein [Candidatus Altiarchaeales archaeon]